ncbi:MAG TPA: pectinesterase family protein [Chitinophagaceae bacterium]|nr:pectinesterase family protein [Chitinophagaceae bacterium]
MILLKKIHCFILVVLITAQSLYAQHNPALKKIIVDINGRGNYTSIQAAINSLPDSAALPRIIYIKKGVYKEKLYIEKQLFTLEGEDRETTIITQAIARDQWRCLHNEDWGVATVNIDGNDITLKNLTVINSYGFDTKEDKTIYCPLDTLTGQKKITPSGHQMALRTMNNTRLKAINCHFTAYAGDTVSPWNTENGMFYFKDCIIEGGVDFYCPRGWAYAENCRFIAHTGVASIWHDGSKNKDAKTVLKSCSFSGFDGFKLGRYHKDAQFYLINCSFAANMADEDIYLVATNNILLWGRRIYYFNCHRDGPDFTWYANNLDKAEGIPESGNINAAWVFNNKWNPAE